ncbi:MFS transporter [Rufibacter psychrotolerans]|uniref:MFS transporter n=1 Tax=Rufibacter psychrotolerans TaxID=2812556 RepID=UPI00293D6D85|nr:MFS transporter [Rufibacter sp. SYSU D00308]
MATSSPIPEERHDPYAVLRIPEFRLFISARFCITLAMQIQAVVVGWQIYDITKDPFSLGLIGLVEAIPSITVALYAGHVADIIPRKRIIITVLSVLLFCSVALLLYTLDIGKILHQFGTLPIYSVIFLSGIARGFMGPAVFSFMPQLLPDRKFYANAITWSSSTWQAASVAGPAIGGLVYAFGGVSAAFGVDAALVLCALILYGLIAGRPLPVSEGPKLKIKESLQTGLKFVFGNQIILSALALDMFAVLFGGAVALLPVFASDILKIGPQGLGLLRSAPAIGSVTMAVFMAYRPITNNAGKKMLWAVAGFGACIIGFGLSNVFWLSFALLLMSGVLDSVSVIIRSTLIHTLTPEHMKGRVSSVNNIFVGSSNEIGSFESGLAAKLLGVVPSVVFGGTMTILIVAFTAWKADKLRKLSL